MAQPATRTTIGTTVSVKQPACMDCGSGDVIDRGPCRPPTVGMTLSSEEMRLATSCVASKLLQCRACGLGFRFPAVREDIVHRMYEQMPADFWQYTGKTNVAWYLARRWLQKRHRASRAVRVVDVGAFDGSFLRTLSPTWDVRAIEPSAAARHSLDTLGIRCIAEFLSEPLPSNRNCFDVVTMFDVFEHFTSPSKSLQDALAHLKPGGHLILSTGNLGHWTWQLLGGEHWYLSSMQHVSFGTLQYFEQAAQRFGSRLVAFRRHAHQKQGWRHFTSQMTETLVYAGRRSANPLLRLCAKAMLRVPLFHALRHSEHAPYSPAIRDHVLVILQKEHSNSTKLDNSENGRVREPEPPP